MDALDRKKKQAEIARMQSNILDAEVQIEERMLEIQRIKDRIGTFNKRIDDLTSEIQKE